MEPAFFSAQIAAASRFYLDLSPPRGTALAVVSGGVEHCRPDYEMRRTSFPYFGIEFVARGRGTLRLGNRSQSLAAGVLFTYGPGVAHRIVTDAADPLVKYFVDFTGRQALPLLTRHGLAPGRVTQTAAPAEIAGLFDQLIRSSRRPTPFTPRLAPLLLEALVLKAAETALRPGEAVTAAFATYQRCRTQIDKSWASLPSLAAAARACHVDAAYLCRLWRRFDHETPYQYLQRLKMTDAARRLHAPGRTVKAVAADLGYGDAFHFSRVFKRVMGLSPSRFAQLNQR